MVTVAVRGLVSSLLLVAVAAAPARSQGQVLEVSNTGPLFSLQMAVDMAADGDTILVQTGGYSPPSIAGRSLTITAAEGSIAAVGGNVESDICAEIRDLQAGDAVVLHGLRLQGLKVTNCHGTVWVEDCQIDKLIPALRVDSSTGVVFVRSTITGPDKFTEDTTLIVHPSGDAAHLTDSVVELLDSTVKGGTGQGFGLLQAGGVAPSPGEDAIELHGGALRLCGGSVQGGAGGSGGSPNGAFCLNGEDGGASLRLLDGSPHLTVCDTLVAGGAGGALPGYCVPGTSHAGAPGSPLVVDSGIVDTIPGTARHLELSGPVTEHSTLHVLVGGVPGDLVLLLVGLQPGVVPKAPSVGTLLVPAPILVVSLGVLGSSELDLPLTLPELGPHVPTVHAFVQGAFKPAAAGGAVLGSGSVLIVLDSIY